MDIMNEDDHKVALGALGEYIVSRMYKSLGCDVEYSSDEYDSVKDMIVNGMTVEVKTLMALCNSLYYSDRKSEAFTIRPNQHRKCTQADRLIFVQVPYDDESCFRVYSLKDRSLLRYYSFGHNQGYYVPLELCELVYESWDIQLVRLLKLLCIGNPAYRRTAPHHSQEAGRVPKINEKVLI